MTGCVELTLFEPVCDLLVRWDMTKARGMLFDRETCTIGQFCPQVALHLSNNMGIEFFVIKPMLHVSAWSGAQAANCVQLSIRGLTLASVRGKQHSTRR